MNPLQRDGWLPPPPPPPPGAFYAGPTPIVPPLPGLGGMGQVSPGGLATQRSSIAQHDQIMSSQIHNPPSQLQTYPLPAIHQAAPAQSLPSQQTFDRERELQEARQREARDREKEQLRREQQREREERERDIRERQQREQPLPHQNYAEPIQLHQPVAIGPQMRAAIHGPNGLLATPGALANQNTASGPAGGPMSLFTPQYETAPRQSTQHLGQHPAQLPASNMLAFSGGIQGLSGMPNPIAQGQQPILNDALSYLDQVKVQFSTDPNVYNQFLDIMKDFKSQSIDTPGVIRRVSCLFIGHPNLIQGFNTFLPPGYRIECGTADDPHAIRVTTPQGTTVSPMGSTLALPPAHHSMANSAMHGRLTPGPEPIGGGPSGAWSLQTVSDQFDGSYSPASRAQVLSGLGHQLEQNQGRMSPFDLPSHREQQLMPNNAALLAHQQEQRGVSQLQNAVSAATGEALSRPGMSGVSPLVEAAIPLSGAMNIDGLVSQQGGPSGMEKTRGPVEFNHAISYVNKIKTRFNSQPEIYKQFLEILQTYQRESKPIQDVYAQVTTLFNGAPDLLEAFKQFLPESAAHAKAAAARQAAEDATMLSHVRGNIYGNEGPPSHHTPRPEQHRLPPLGNFAPTPSAGRDVKRKRVDRHVNAGFTAMDVSAPVPEFGNAGGQKNGLGPNKRTKQSQNQHQSTKLQAQLDLPSVTPNLVPALPQPMLPAMTTAATSEEIAFFDRVKKFISNKNTMNEFLKLCNLFSQDLIDVNLLVHRMQNFIGSSPELFNWFKAFVKYDGKDQMIENRAKPVTGRVSLNNCRLVGSSYRFLPKRERLKPCSGRDELCNSVLNDEWASHPTWASEDSGFVAHRKNQHEEALHRIEEERHDYDHNIAIMERTIQILEPLAQQNRMMSPEEREVWTLPADMGGQSQAIYRKVISKVYGRELGRKVMESLFEKPGNVIPVLLTRCRLLLETWKASQREWDKVWRDQTQRMFWKSLDHQGIIAKQADKRQFQTKTLQNEIHVKYEEQKRQRLTAHNNVPKNQAEYSFSDVEVLMDASHLILTYAEQTHSTDYPRLTGFIKEFVPLFFGLDHEAFQQRIRDIFETTPSNEEDEEEAPAFGDIASTRTRKANGKKGDLLRDVLEKGRKPNKNHKEESLGSRSRASTPGGDTVADEEMSDTVEDVIEEGAKTWFNHPIDDNLLRKRNVKPNEPYKRHVFNLYANLPIYCFFRMFVILYDRLLKLKSNEREVHDIVRRAKAPKAASELRMLDKRPDDYFSDTSVNANYYHQMLVMLQEQIRGESGMDMSHIEEILRRYYLQNGWMLYSFDKMLGALVRFAIAVLSNESKDKSYEIVQLFLKDRRKEKTTHQDELAYRRMVEKYVKDGDVYRIAYSHASLSASIRILKRDDLTFSLSDPDGLLTLAQRWTYYISSYSSLPPTEGIPQALLYPSFLTRNLHLLQGLESAAEKNVPRWNRLTSHEGLGLRISPDTYRIHYTDKGTEEWWMARPRGSGSGASAGAATAPTFTTAMVVGQDEPTLDGDGDGMVDDTESRTGAAVAVPATATAPAGSAAEEHVAAAAAAAAAAADADIKINTTTRAAHHAESSRHDHDAAGVFEEMFVMNNKWMAGLTKDEVDERKGEFRGWRGEVGVPVLVPVPVPVQVEVEVEGGLQGVGDGSGLVEVEVMEGEGDGEMEGEDVVMSG